MSRVAGRRFVSEEIEIGNSSKWFLFLSGIDTYRFGNYMLACIGSLSDSPPNLKFPVYEFGHHMYHLTFMNHASSLCYYPG